MATRRLVVLLLVLAGIAVPAGALRAACAGRSCATDQTPARVPFCPLPSWIKGELASGYREERSPDVLAVTERTGLSDGPTRPPWPSVADSPGTTDVPIVFWGRGVDPSARVAAGTKLDRIAPTVADAIGLRRPHPEVRSGVAVPAVASGRRPTLVVEIALGGIGTADVEGDRSWPALDGLAHTGAGTMSGATGSLPLDPAATLTTIGTGGRPDEHGITGALVRNDGGRVVTAWGDGSPPSVISTLADDLDAPAPARVVIAGHAIHNGTPKIGLVAPSISDRGLVGGTWYPGGDRDELEIGARDPVQNVRDALARGYGADATPDILGVVLDGHARGADDEVSAIVEAATKATRGAAMIVVAGTGSTTPARGGLDPVLAQVEDAVPGAAPVVSGSVAGGVFLDQAILAREHISGQAVVDALLDATDTDGGPLVRDAFQGFAVSFGRYC